MLEQDKIDQDEIEGLRRAFRGTLPNETAAADCPPAERIFEAALGRVAPTELAALVDHLAGCPVCAEAWRLAVALEGEPTPQAVRRLPWRRLAVLAATVVLAIGFWPRDQPPQPPAFRTLESAAVELLNKDQPLLRSHCLLRWTPIEGALYNLEVATDSLDWVDHAQGLEASEYLVPEARLAGLPRGGRLRIRVEAYRPGEDRRVARTFVVTVR